MGFTPLSSALTLQGLSDRRRKSTMSSLKILVVMEASLSSLSVSGPSLLLEGT